MINPALPEIAMAAPAKIHHVMGHDQRERLGIIRCRKVGALNSAPAMHAE
jgi:hypothetical protein